MNCECNNNSNRVQPRIKHVYGNVLRIAIPLTLRTLVKDGDEVIVTDTDFVPSADHAVRVVFSKGKTNYPIIATMDGNVAIVEDRGKIPVGTYDISVECYDDLGNPYRFKQNAVLCVTDTTAEAGIEEEIEYEAQTWYLNAAVFLATTEIGEIGDVIDAKLDDVFGDAVYDATAKEIRFFDKSGTRLLTTIDSRPFVVDGTVEDVYIDVSRQVLVVVLNEDAGGRRFSVPLYLVFNDYYKKGEVDRRIALAMTDAQLQFNQKLPLIVPVTQSGSTISSTMDFGVLNNAIREDGREVVACINNSRFYQLLGVNGDEIVFSAVNAADGFQTLLAVHENNVWALEYVEIGTGGSFEQIQADWNQTNTSAKDFIKNKPTIPTDLGDLTNNAGYTKNLGTITGITMNNVSKGTSGVVDLGTVITEHQDISGKADKSTTYTKDEVDDLVDDIEAGETVVINSDGANIENSLSDSILTAASSRMVKEIYLNLQKLFDPVNGLANIAFVGTRPTWQTVPIPEHTITLGTMSNVSASLNGTAISSSADAPEGEVTISLTPAQGTMILTENISIKLGTEDVPFTTATDNGSTLVTFILAGDVTFSASASSGIGVQVNGSNVSANVGGIALSGDNRTIILSHPEHYDWSGSIALSVNSVALVENTDYTIVSNQDGTKTITVLKTFTSDAYPIVITTAATLQDSIDVTFSVTGAVITHGSETLGGSVTVYSGDKPYRITIQPESGKSWSSAPTATGGTLTHSGEVYTLVINAADTSDIVVAGSAREAGNLTINLPLNTAHVVLKASDNSTPISTNPTVSDSGSEGWTGYISAEQTSGPVDYNNTYDSYDLTEVKVMMGNNDITSSAFNPSTGKIEIDAVTDNVTVTAKVMTFHEGRGIHQSSGNLTPVRPSSDTIDKYGFCATDFIAIPSGTASVVVDLGEDGVVSPSVNMAFYNSEYGFISSEGITGAPNIPKLARYKKIAVPSGAAYLRTTIYTDQNVTYNGDAIESIERVNSVRKSRYVLAIDGGGNKSYLYKGIDYDGRYEDVYPLTFGDVIKCKIATETILDTPTNSNVSSGMMTGLIEIPDGCTALTVRLGVLDYYTKYYANIAYYDANQAKLSNYFIVSGDVEETATPPSGAAYIRISTNKPDTSYVVVVGGNSAGDYLFKGILVE